MNTAEAYRACEDIAWSQARNFAYGIRPLPAWQTAGPGGPLAFARRIDDIGDGTLPPRPSSRRWKRPGRTCSA